ncbi:MAG: NTP transferase domain-containing protein [Cytophagales bacterium]|nr:NTP transferase domain-containing protein [Armatimonadota bacterium]
MDYTEASDKTEPSEEKDPQAMRAVILAGERGAPLYPLTARQPRAMLPLAGKPLIQYQLELLKRHGITDVILCLQSMPEAFESRFGDGKAFGMTLRYHREQVPLGTAGAVRSVADRLVDENVLVLNGHVLMDADLTALIHFHEQTQAAVTMLLAVSENPSQYGVVVTDDTGRITSFAEKPAIDEAASDTVNAGVYVLRRDVLRRMPPDTEYSFERQLFPQLLAQDSPMYGCVAEGRYWRTISTLTDYQRAQADILERRVHVEINGDQVRDGVWVGADCQIHPTAELGGRAFINHHTEIGKDARIGGVTSIGSRCRIGEGAVIEDAILYRGTVIEAGATVRGCILGDNCVVRAGATVQPGSVVGADGIIASVVARLPTRGDIQRAAIKFGTDGWRGIIADDFTVDNVRLVTQAICDWVKSSTMPGKGVVVGYDRRSQSEVFALAVAQVAQANDLPVYLSDRECSSPAVSFGCRFFGAAVGIMITASHNPPRFNGLKIKAHYGGSATPEMVAQVEDRLRHLLMSGAAPLTTKTSVSTTNIAEPYLAHCARFVDLDRVAKAGFKVVVDPMHGSGAGYLSDLLRSAGVSVMEIRSERNPVFGGVNPEPIAGNMEALFDAVRTTRADVGICLDGDADRLGACDSRGNFVDCHRIFAVLLRHLYEEKGWRGGVVRTVSTTRALDKLTALYSLPLTETPIGFKYICEKMLSEDILIGGEESGGIGVKNHLPERDGVLMGILLLEAMATKGKRLEDLIEDIFALVGPHEYTRTDLHPPQEKMHLIISALASFRGTEFAGAALERITRKDGTRLDFTDGSWLLLRPSGTEPVVRVYAEAASQERARELVDRGVALVQNV